jgi:hypothetical protein
MEDPEKYHLPPSFLETTVNAASEFGRKIWIGDA